MKMAATPEQAMPLISKSEFLAGLQCQKLLWTAHNAKHLIPKPDTRTQAIFHQGHAVGALAKRLFPDGLEVGLGIDDPDALLRITEEAVRRRRPLFEPVFSHQGGDARADILVPVGDDAWDLIEVKSSTSLKDVYIFDLAFQAFVINGTGLKIRACFLLLINPHFIRHGDIDPSEFFVRHDVTANVMETSRQIERRLHEMFATTRLKLQPALKIGGHCDSPYPCPLHDQCWSSLPPDNVTTLNRGGKKVFKLLAEGIMSIGDIPEGFPLTQNQKIQRQVAITGQPHVSEAAISDFLRQLEYPVAYLDFETFATAIPLFDHARPFDQIPFQFSLHIVRSPDSQPEHHMFLADGRADPRLNFLQRLQGCLPDSGSIVVYNQQFEQSRLKECCDSHPEFQTWLTNVESRFVDLLKPFREFKYYAPDQNGSASMKVVLPALTDRTYDNLAIREGGTASLEYLRVQHSDVPDGERLRVRRALEEYCGQDTEGMIWIVEELWKLVSQ